MYFVGTPGWSNFGMPVAFVLYSGTHFHLYSYFMGDSSRSNFPFVEEDGKSNSFSPEESGRKLETKLVPRI